MFILQSFANVFFYPVCKSDTDVTECMKELAKIAADAILAELRDKKKATHKYLSSNGKEHSWRHCPEEQKTALLGKSATNNEAESCLGGTTAQVQRFGRLALASAAAISDMRWNAFLHRLTKAKSDKKLRGILYQLDEK